MKLKRDSRKHWLKVNKSIKREWGGINEATSHTADIFPNIQTITNVN